MERVLVTGGAGFIGSHLAEDLVRAGYAVRVLDNLSTGKRDNLAGWDNDLEFQVGDLRNANDCRKAVLGVAVVFHHGAIPAVPRSVADPVETNAANIDGTLNILTAARDAGVRRLVFASSSAIYGNAPELPKREDMAPDPLSPYAVQKLAGEHYVRLFHSLYGFEAVALRYFNVFGPRQDPLSDYAAVIPKFITRMLQGRPPLVFGDGQQTRDFTFVGEVVRANRLAATKQGVGGKVINFASGERISLLQLIDTLNRLLGTDIKPEFRPPQPGDVRDSQADLSRARQLLGYEPSVSFAGGMQETLAWYRSSGGEHAG